MTFTEIKNRVYFLTKTNSNSFPIADLTSAANRSLERVVALINKADSRWEFDDSNNTDLPIATTDLVTDQQDYVFATSHLSINRVEVKDTNGNWQLLKPINRTQVNDQALDEYLKGGGVPREYDKLGRSIFLYPTPNYTSADGLQVYFTRAPHAFETGDTDAEPGFNSLFHDLIPLWVAYDFAMANGLNNINLITSEIQRKEQELREFFGQRSRDERPRMSTSLNRSVGSTSGTIMGGYSDSNK